MKKTEIKAAHIIIVVCLIAAAVMLCFLFNDIIRALGGTSGQGTFYEFKADSEGNGFTCETIVYTENDTTYVSFSGDITTDGTAEIAMLSDDGNTIIHNETYTAVTSEKIKIDVVGLTSDTFYILRFSSNDAKKGHLILTTKQALVEHPKVLEHPERAVPYRNAH